MKKLLLLLIYCILFLDCSSIIRKKELSVDNITIHELCKKIEKNHWKLESLKGSAHLSVETPELSFNALSDITLKSPDSLLVKIKSALGIGAAYIFLEKDNFMLYTSIENKAYYGSTRSQSLKNFLNIDIAFKDLIDLFSGIVIISPNEKSKITINDNQYLIAVKGDQYSKLYWIDPVKFVVNTFHLYDSQRNLILKQDFQNFQKEKGVFLPKIIRVSRPNGKEKITLMYSHRKTNLKIKTGDFSYKLPQNAQKVIY